MSAAAPHELRTIHVGPAPRLAVDCVGSGELVLCLHGIGGNRRQWDAQLPALADEYLACAWDARGYGASDDYAGPLKFETFADDVRRVLDFLGARRAHLVGHSMGGRIARSFALRFPDRVGSLVLANTSPGFDALTAEQVAEFVRVRQKPLLEGKTPAQIAPDVIKRLIGKNPRPGAFDTMVRLMSALHVESYLKTIAASVEQDRSAPVEQLRMPVLVIASDQDPLYAPDLCRRMAERIKGAQFVLIAEAGHLTNVEQPEAFNAAVLTFLRAVTANRPH